MKAINNACAMESNFITQMENSINFTLDFSWIVTASTSFHLKDLVAMSIFYKDKDLILIKFNGIYTSIEVFFRGKEREAGENWWCNLFQNIDYNWYSVMNLDFHNGLRSCIDIMRWDKIISWINDKSMLDIIVSFWRKEQLNIALLL